MSDHFQNRVLRPIRVFTGMATFDGLLAAGLGARTLDELNLTARTSLRLASPCLAGGHWALGEGPLLVNKNMALFVLEIPDLGEEIAASEPPPLQQRYVRTMIRLRSGPYDIQGYIHCLPGTDPMARLSQTGNRPFLALTEATIEGNGLNCAVPFVAVNQAHVLLAQEIMSIQADPDEAAAETGGISS